MHDNSIVAKTKAFVVGRPLFHQMFKYSVVGVFNTIIGLSAMYIFYNVFRIDYVLTNVLAYSLGLINSFIFNKQWTFASKKHYSKEIVPFLTVFLIGYAANMAVLVITVEVLKLNPNISQVLGIGAYTSTNFLLNRYWTFSKAK